LSKDPVSQPFGEDDLLLLGRVIKPHGVKGKMKIDYFGDDPGRLLVYRQVLIEDDRGRLRSYEVLEVTPQPPRILLSLRGIDRIEDVLSLLGRRIFIPKKSLPELEPGEFYWFEILGMDVETEEGQKIGKVKDIIPTAAHDVFVLEGKTREICLPAGAAVIQGIDRTARIIRGRRMEGLWEKDDEV
jgi:16S rRNA processing protein RimM